MNSTLGRLFILSLAISVPCMNVLAKDSASNVVKTARARVVRFVKGEKTVSPQNKTVPGQSNTVSTQSKTVPAEGRAVVQPSPQTEYLIGSGDVLQVSVWHEAEISGKTAVRPDGKISLPLVGDVQAGGLTPKMLQANVTEKLQAYVTDPEVAIVVEQINSRKFTVMGEVQHPGTYPLSSPTRVLDALAIAGGFREFARVNKIYVLRPTTQGANKQYPFDYNQVVKGKNPGQNCELQPGDTVVVP